MTVAAGMCVYNGAGPYLCSRQEELSSVMKDVGTWWSGCEEGYRWLEETEADMVTHKPLASSLDIIEQQKKNVQVSRPYSSNVMHVSQLQSI